MTVFNELNEAYTVSAICDVLDFRIEEAKAISTTPYSSYKDYRKLLDDKNIKAVAIAVPLHLHYPITVDALKAGKHVFLEKTMTYNIPEAIDLVKQSQQYNQLTLQVGHQYRYTPLYNRVKEMIEKDYLGKVTQIDCRWDRNTSWRRQVPPGINDRVINWRMYKEYSGGLVAELLSHQIDFINWAFNTHPDTFFATGGIDFYEDGRETYDNVQVVLRYNKDQMIGNFGATCGNAHDGYIFKIKGTKGSVHLLVDDGVFYPEPEQRKQLETVDGVTGATKIEWNKEGGIPITKEPYKDGTWYALADFHTSIMQRKMPSSNVFTGATTATCVHLANEALYNQNIQGWKEEYNYIS
jgi:predicted dehydrogenase